MSRPPLPPFDEQTAIEKVRLAEDGWNSRDAAKVALAYTIDTRWRNRAEFLIGRAEAEAFLTRKWHRELDYRLIKELWAFQGNRIAVSLCLRIPRQQRAVVSCLWQRELGIRRGWADAGAPRKYQ